MLDFYANGSHLGAALHRVLASTSVLGFSACDLLEAGALENGTLPDRDLTVRLAEGVYVRKGLDSFLPSPSTTPFVFPPGIVRKVKDGVLDLGGGKDCFEKRVEDARFTLCMRLQKDTFSKFLFRALQGFPEISSVHITVRGDSGSGYKQGKWAANSLEKAELLHFLKIGRSHVLENGFVGFTVFAKGNTLQLKVDEQKHLWILARHEKDFQFFLQLANSFGVEEVGQVPSVELCHYRLHKSANNRQLVEFLTGCGFRKEYNTFLSPVMRYILFDSF